MNGCSGFYFLNNRNGKYNSVSHTTTIPPLWGCAENLNFFNLLSYFGPSSFPCSPRLCTTGKHASSPTLTIQAFRFPKPNSVSGSRPAFLKPYWVKPTPLIPGQDKRESGAREDDVTVAGRDLRLLWALRPLRVLTEDRSVGDAVAMTICQFFLQGRCRFGDRCWNEHPGAGGAGGGRQQQPSGSNRRGWNTTSQRYSSVIQPSSFSKSTPWGGSRDQEKPSFNSGASTSRNRGFGVSQNPFASPSPDGQKDEKKLLEGIIKDMEIWESSGQWMFSVYSPMKKKPNISGFTDISPEELRLEYHNFLTSNNLQSYLNSLQQLINQWRNRINELKSLNTSTNIALLSNVKDGVNQAAPAFGFGSTHAVTFGSPGFPVNNSSSANAQNFSFKPSSGFASAPSGSPPVFGNTPAFGAASSASSAITTSVPAFGFGKPAITSAASFSFKSPAATGFGSPGFSGFPASMAAGSFGAPGAPAFGSGTSVAGFGSLGSHSHTAFSKSSSDTFGNSSISTSLPVSNGSTATDNELFTPKDQLTAEELEQFQSKKFTLGKIPLKPPPTELLNI